jgi:hypothetical protein
MIFDINISNLQVKATALCRSVRLLCNFVLGARTTCTAPCPAEFADAASATHIHVNRNSAQDIGDVPSQQVHANLQVVTCMPLCTSLSQARINIYTGQTACKHFLPREWATFALLLLLQTHRQ